MKAGALTPLARCFGFFRFVKLIHLSSELISELPVTSVSKFFFPRGHTKPHFITCIYYMILFQSHDLGGTVWVVFEIVKSYVKYDFGSGAGRSPSLAWALPVLWIRHFTKTKHLIFGVVGCRRASDDDDVFPYQSTCEGAVSLLPCAAAVSSMEYVWCLLQHMRPA